MASPLASEIISCVTSVLTTGKGSITVPTQTENVDVAGIKLAVSEDLTVTIVKS